MEPIVATDVASLASILDMPFKVTMLVRSRVTFDDDLVEDLFDALTDSMPIPLGCFDAEMAAKPGTTDLDLIYEMEEVESIETAGAWSLVALRDALRELDRTHGLDAEDFTVVSQQIERWDPETRETEREAIERVGNLSEVPDVRPSHWSKRAF